MTVYLFDHCELDCRRRQLRRDGVPVALQPLVFDLLQYFATHPGRVIGREELLQAAWRSTAVSNSVVARAIMKARRAIGDDAAEPRLLHTVARAGYRFDGRVSLAFEAPDATVALAGAEPGAWLYAVLPLQGAAHPLAAGLPALAHRLLSEAEAGSVAPLDDVLEISQGAPAGDPMERACRLLGAQQALGWQLEPQGDGWRLRLFSGRSQRSAQLRQREGRDPTRLLRQLLAELLGQAWPEDGRAAADAAAHEAVVAAWAQRLQPRAALQALAPALLGPRSPWLLSLQARLLQAAGDPEAAATALQSALQLPAAASGMARAQLLLAQAALARDRMQLDIGLAACAEAQPLLEAGAQGRALLPELLALQAAMLRLRKERDGALRAAERALSLSLISGSRLAEARARLQLATLLTLLDQSTQAAEMGRLAVQHARQVEVPALELRASAMLMMLSTAQRQFDSGVQLARRTRLLAQDCGDAAIAQQAQVFKLYCLVSADRLGEAAAVPLLQAGEVMPRFAIPLLLGRSLLCWKQGERAAALALLDDAYAEMPPAQRGHLAMLPLQQQRGLMMLSLGRREAGRAVLQQLLGADADTAAHAAAALALDEGEPARAQQLLEAWLQASPGTNVSQMDNRLCLAWLRLEAESPAAPDASLDSLAAKLVDYAPEFLPARLFVAAYLLRRAPGATSRARWDRLMAEALPLRQRFAWMGGDAYRDALQAGRAQRLPELLTQACL